MENHLSDRATAILNFWFGAPNDSEYGQQRQAWFKKNPEFDAEIRQRFLSDYERAAAGEYDSWQAQPRSCVALILLLDQFPRNLFRNSPQAFATDSKALNLAQYAVAQGFDRQLIPAERMFVYLPFEHCEELAQQYRCVQLFEQLMVDAPEFESTLEYALRHRDVIERFGRFPHRNEVLNRETTSEEAEFLQQPGSRF